MQSWQVYHAALKKLPPGMLQNLYRRSSRLIHYWAADPRYCEETKRNPLDRIRDMLDALDAAGAGEFARWAIDYMAAPLSGHFVFNDPATSDKGSIEGEVCDVTIALGKLADEIRFARQDGDIDGQELARIKDYARQLKREVDELLDAAGIDQDEVVRFDAGS